jgi:hypothetical protein
MARENMRKPARKESAAVEQSSEHGPHAALQQGIDLGNLAACVEDARRAALDLDPGPADPEDYAALRGRLEAVRTTLPPLYQEQFYQPYVRKLDALGRDGFVKVLLKDPKRERTAGLLLDAAHAILQNGERYEQVATDAFQELVSDLYDGFLSAEDRRGVQPPDQGTTPPLVKWGNPDFGPYTWTISATANLGLGAAIVNMPPANARGGLLAWPALCHETVGHDVLHADTGLQEELAQAVYTRLEDKGFESLANYWASRIDETASDVMGILNMGPTAGIGLLGYFRGLDAAYGGAGQLRNEGPSDDSHPADILRGYLAAATVQRLEFSKAKEWATRIEKETDKDVGRILIEGREVSLQRARLSADEVADTIMTHRAAALEGHALAHIQNWRDGDEARAQQLKKQLLAGPGELSDSMTSGTYAAHLVAGAVMAGLTQGVHVPSVFGRMVRLLKQMHDGNPAWGPLYVRHRGDLVPHFAYRRQAR